MAAYDLTVQRPSLLAIPDTFNRSANNVLNAVRLAQERKNNEDKMELDNRRQSFIEGAPQRERDAQKALNQSLAGGLQSTRQNFIDNFIFDAQNRAAIESDERFANATAEQQKAYWDTVTGKINANIGKNTDPRLYEGNLRAQLAKTSATQEQIDNYVANEMTRVYGTGDTELARTLAAASLRGSGTGSQGGYNKLPRMDDPGFAAEERAFVKEWLDDAGAAKGNGKSLNPLTWFDPGGNNLTEQNVNAYVNSMRNNHGLTAAQSLQALETVRDGDELEVNFNEMMNADINGNSNASKALRKVVTAGMGMRDLRLQGTAAGGNQTGSSADFASILASASRRGTTVAQRRDLLFAELTTMFGPKAAKEMAEEATDSKVPKSVVEKVEKANPSPNAGTASDVSLPELQEIILGNSGNHRNSGLFNRTAENSTYNGKPFLPSAPVSLEPNLAKGLAEYLNSGQ